MGAVHGFAGNVLPALRGRDLLPEGERKKWLECIARTLRATAIHDGELVNWPQSVGKHRLGRTALLVQHCHGAPGIVNCVADFPSSGIDDLLLAAGETIWRAGPVQRAAVSATAPLVTGMRSLNYSSELATKNGSNARVVLRPIR